MEDSSIHAWLKSQGYWKQSGSSADSHLFLDGGVACVPETMTATFNNVYAASLFRGETTFVVEKKTKVFRMFFDLDMRTKTPVPDDMILVISNIISKTVVEFFRLADDATTMIVCLSEPTWSPTVGWKTGVHLSWPQSATTTPDALRCRDLVIDAVKNSPCATWFTNDISAVIDKSVLDKNGMRMIGAHKLVSCPTCSAATATGCETCRGRRKVVQKGVYWPRYAISAATTTETVEHPTTMADLRRWIAATSLRVVTVPQIVVESRLGGDEADEELLLETSHGGRLTRESVREHAESLEAFVAKSLPKEFADARVTAMYRTENDVILARTNSNYCLNIGRRHRTNNVYFLITDKGAYQMCFCRCETVEGRKHGLCRDFHSKMFHVDANFRRALFGTTAGDDLVRPIRPLKKVVGDQYENLMKYYMNA